LALSALAKSLKETGSVARADSLLAVAVEIELESAELQACWGGPFNGQTERIRLVEDLLARAKPAVVLETGSFRGLSTAWLATHFSGPVLSCEIEPLYSAQAKHNTEQYPNVVIYTQDSRAFLKERLHDIDPDACVFIYIDAHWENSLPLHEELAIIFASHSNPLVMIDDFRVPFDDAYGWDDYGPGLALDISLLRDVVPPGVKVYFPNTPAAQESGAKRGCCVLMKGALLESSPLLVGHDLNEWLSLDNGKTDGEAQATSQRPTAEASKSYPEQILNLNVRLTQIQKYSEARLQQIKWLTAELEKTNSFLSAVDADRQAKQEIVDRLVGELQAVDADRHAKQEIVDRLVGELQVVNADRHAKQEVVDRLLRKLNAIENDRQK
jgi:predicted O-methyltransferase YrrM